MAHRRCGARHTNGCANGQEGLRARCRWGSRGGVGPEAGSPAPWHAVLPEVDLEFLRDATVRDRFGLND